MTIELEISGIVVATMDYKDPPKLNPWQSSKWNYERRKKFLDRAIQKFDKKYKTLLDLNKGKTCIYTTVPSGMNSWSETKNHWVLYHTGIKKQLKKAS